MPCWWNTYPDPVLEIGRLEMCKKLIQAAQDPLVQQDNGGKKQIKSETKPSLQHKTTEENQEKNHSVQ